MSDPLPTYSELTRRYFDAPVNVGVLRGLGVGSAEAGSLPEGTWVRFHVQILHDTVTAARFNAFGCPHLIAAASWLTESTAGTRAVAALPEPAPALLSRFGMPAEKLGRLLLIEDAWIAAIRAAITKSRAALD